ncbi:MAG: YkvA family protein [Tepidiformaceae bacterium]
MPWYGWILLALFVFLALTAIALRAMRLSRRGRRFLSLSTQGKVSFGRRLLADPQVSLVAKATLVVMVGYLAMPFDLIPDFIPVVGQLDDFAIVILAVGLLMIAVPKERFDAALASCEVEQERRRAEKAIPQN